MATTDVSFQSWKVLISLLLLVLEVWNVKPTYRKSWAVNLLMWSDLTLGPLLQGQTKIAKLKSAYNSLFLNKAAGSLHRTELDLHFFVYNKCYYHYKEYLLLLE